MVIKRVNRLSKIFQPLYTIPKNVDVKRTEITSKSQRLLVELGVIKQANPGCFHLLPLGLKSLEKLVNLADREMEKIDGQKVVFPTLTNSKLWTVSGRYDAVSSELFKLKDRHEQNYVLSPTHEEAATDLFKSSEPISYRQLPLKLYQITNKFRDEIKPRFGLMRAKQFLMKDMYSFDVDVESAHKTYQQVCDAYQSFFSKLQIDFVKVVGLSGTMGGNMSHEFHYKSDIGEDKILSCAKCGYAANCEVIGHVSAQCPSCKSTPIDITSGIEVGHTFFLGDKYSKPFKATFLNQTGKPQIVQMGSYGLGLSRIMAASVQVLSNENEVRWPSQLAPFKLVIIPPKSGSKEESQLADSGKVDELYNLIASSHFSLANDVLVDDRTSLTIGRRFLEAKRMGYPLIIVLGNKLMETPPQLEIYDVSKQQQIYCDENELMQHVHDKFISQSWC